MADYIFSQTTCLKQDIYPTIKNIMISAGWSNISSNPTVDGDVMYSTGETGDKALTVCMRSSNTTATNDTTTTDLNVMSYRLPESYIAGAVGVSGTFGRAVASEAWKGLYIANTTTAIARTTTVTIYYHCNKNRIIFAIIYPDASGQTPIMHYIGMPDELYVATTGSRDVIVASSGGMSTGLSYLYISNAVASMPSDATSTQRVTSVTLPPKQVNADGNVIMEDIKYGNTTEGYRGKLTGLFALGSANPVISTGNIITIGSKQYTVVVCGGLNYNSFTSLYLAIQTA